MRLLNLRLIPIVILAAAALFVLKVSGLVIDRGYALVASRSANAQGIGMTPVLDLDTRAPATIPATVPVVAPAPPPAAAPTATVTTTAKRGDRKPPPNPPLPPAPPELVQVPSEVTGSVPAAKAEKAPEGPPPPTKVVNATSAGEPQVIDHGKAPMTAGERAVLESLVQRRQELEARAREIDVRESLLKAAEQRIDQRLQELQEAEARVSGATKKREENDSAKFKNLVTMYENMKPKEAAKVFDRLDMRVLLEVVNLMNPRRMSDILALMQADVAEKLTVEIANRSGADRGTGVAPDLPKIDGVKPGKS